MSGTQRDEERVLGPRKLKVQTVLSCHVVLGAEPSSSVLSTLSDLFFSPSKEFVFKIMYTLCIQCSACRPEEESGILIQMVVSHYMLLLGTELRTFGGEALALNL